MKEKIAALEKEVETVCSANENNCNTCPMKAACNRYTKATTDAEKLEALEAMIKESEGK